VPYKKLKQATVHYKHVHLYRVSKTGDTKDKEEYSDSSELAAQYLLRSVFSLFLFSAKL
jgi:hypothetical protein